MKTVKYGIIGIGNMGYTHFKSFMKGAVENATVTAIADPNEKRWELLKKDFPDAQVAFYKDGSDLIQNADVDAVVVAVPHYDHPRYSIEAMEKGIAVVCEKPAGVYTKQVKEMNAVADRTGVPFTVMFNQRTLCTYRKMREIILSGGVGEIKRINWIITNWYRSQAYYNSSDWRATWTGEGGGVLFNQCPHQLDLIQWVTGMTPKTVHAHCHFGKWHDIEVEDDVTAYMEYENGATGVFVTSTADWPGSNRLEVTGSRGTIILEEFRDNRPANFSYVQTDDEREFCFETKNPFGKPTVKEMEVETDGKNPRHVGIFQNFTNYLLGKEELFVKGQEGIKGVELMDAMMLSGWLNKAVSLPVDEDLYLAELDKRRAASKKKATVAEVEDVDMSSTFGS